MKVENDFKWRALQTAIEGLEHIYGFFLSPETMTLVGDTMAALRVEQKEVADGIRVTDG